MNFKEEFPSFKNFSKGNLSGNDEYEFTESNIKKYCLDKHIVIEAINELDYDRSGEHSYTNQELLDELKDNLKKDLKLK